jgi:hypothetical protein
MDYGSQPVANLKCRSLCGGVENVAGSAVLTFLFAVVARILVLTVLSDILKGTPEK